MSSMIHVENLQRRFGEIEAVRGISFDVEAGKIFGLLGHNGAGKSTTIKMLTGQIRPTGGKASVGGYDVVQQREQVMKLIGVVFEQQNLYERMTARDNLQFFADLHGVNGTRVDDLIAQVGLAGRAKEKVKGYSNGMRQRLMIARALLHEPKVLFLDEPTRGLDPNSARLVREMIAALRDKGTTVILTTHYMEEADQLSDTVAFISEGKLVAIDTPQNLKLLYGQKQMKVLLADNSEHVVQLNTLQDAAQFARWMGEGQVVTAHSQEATLEDVFIQLTGRDLSEEPVENKGKKR